MAEKPKRVQRRRTRGLRKPALAVAVDRSTNWGNPYDARAYGADPAVLVDLFRDWLTKSDDPAAAWRRDRLADLRGKDLMCWCPLDQPCHADVLLELANRPADTED